ncbi:Protein O-mannosyl-transferase 2 [Lucilia cuprina]|nr:Protein O-mannosyl-transferase 2 [Lucilia cuprina]
MGHTLLPSTPELISKLLSLIHRCRRSMFPSAIWLYPFDEPCNKWLGECFIVHHIQFKTNEKPQITGILLILLHGIFDTIPTFVRTILSGNLEVPVCHQLGTGQNHLILHFFNSIVVSSVSFSVYAPGFLARFIESHAVMFQGNSGLKPKEGEITSRPWQWPINYRGQFFSGSSYRIYLLGNPIIWWSNLVFLTLFVIVFVFNAIKQRREDGIRYLKCITIKTKNINGGCELKTNQQSLINSMTLKAAIWLFFGWIIHYLPFWAMGRVLYFHHYFPALIFNSMLSGVMFHYITSRLPRWLQHSLLGGLMSVLVYSFLLFSPLAYGMSGPLANEPNSTMHGLKWLSTWEF